jgi:NAD(P)H-nitrite reductase large subunit
MGKIRNHICECKAVRKAEIISAIKQKKAETLLDIQNLTKATTSCGRCKPLVYQILEEEIKKNNRKDRQLKINFE